MISFSIHALFFPGKSEEEKKRKGKKRRKKNGPVAAFKFRRLKNQATKPNHYHLHQSVHHLLLASQVAEICPEASSTSTFPSDHVPIK